MARWCYQLLLVLILGFVMRNVVKTDDQNFRDHCCTYFARLDCDNDLKLTDLDLIKLAEKTLTIVILNNPFAELGKIFKFGDQFLNFIPLLDTTTLQATLSGGVTLKQFLTSMAKRRCTPELKQDITELVKFVHSICNADGDDDELTKRELGLMYQVLGIDLSALDAGFSDMDYNHDNMIEVSEDNTTTQLYFCEAPLDDPSNSYDGPIIACEKLVNGDLSKLP